MGPRRPSRPRLRSHDGNGRALDTQPSEARHDRLAGLGRPAPRPHLGQADQRAADPSRLRNAGRRSQSRRMHGQLADIGRENASAGSACGRRRKLDFRLDGALAFTPEKIAVRQGLAETARFSVRNSDLDVNGHVNNTRYAQWILDSTPLEAHRTWRVDRYEVNFLAEIQVGDAVAIEQRAARSVVKRRAPSAFPGKTLVGRRACVRRRRRRCRGLDRAETRRPLRLYGRSLFTNNSRPISMRRISLVPAPIS